MVPIASQELVEDARREQLEREVKELSARLGRGMDGDIQRLLACRVEAHGGQGGGGNGGSVVGSAWDTASHALQQRSASAGRRRRPELDSTTPSHLLSQQQHYPSESPQSLATKKLLLHERLRHFERDVGQSETDEQSVLETQNAAQAKLISSLQNELRAEQAARTLLQRECESLRAEVGAVREYEQTLAGLIDENRKLQQAFPSTSPPPPAPTPTTDPRRQRMLADLSRRLASQAQHTDAATHAVCAALTELRVFIALQPADWTQTAQHLREAETRLEEAEERCLAAGRVGERRRDATPSPTEVARRQEGDASDDVALLRGKQARLGSVQRQAERVREERATLKRRLSEVRQKRHATEDLLQSSGGGGGGGAEVEERIRTLAARASTCEAGIHEADARMDSNQRELQEEAMTLANEIAAIAARIG